MFSGAADCCRLSVFGGDLEKVGGRVLGRIPRRKGSLEEQRRQPSAGSEESWILLAMRTFCTPSVREWGAAPPSIRTETGQDHSQRRTGTESRGKTYGPPNIVDFYPWGTVGRPEISGLFRPRLVVRVKASRLTRRVPPRGGPLDSTTTIQSAAS